MCTCDIPSLNGLRRAAIAHKGVRRRFNRSYVQQAHWDERAGNLQVRLFKDFKLSRFPCCGDRKFISVNENEIISSCLFLYHWRVAEEHITNSYVDSHTFNIIGYHIWDNYDVILLKWMIKWNFMTLHLTPHWMMSLFPVAATTTLNVAMGSRHCEWRTKQK